MRQFGARTSRRYNNGYCQYTGTYNSFGRHTRARASSRRLRALIENCQGGEQTGSIGLPNFRQSLVSRRHYGGSPHSKPRPMRRAVGRQNRHIDSQRFVRRRDRNGNSYRHPQNNSMSFRFRLGRHGRRGRSKGQYCRAKGPSVPSVNVLLFIVSVSPLQ